MDETHFNVMIMVLTYFWMTRKYLFYYFNVNWYSYVVPAAMNLSICMMDRYGIQIQSDIRHSFTPMEIPTKCIYWYILVAMRIVLLFPGIVHGVNYTQIYRWNISIGIF